MVIYISNKMFNVNICIIIIILLNIMGYMFLIVFLCHYISKLFFLKAFGCEAFVHIDKENRTKFEAKSKKCTFIGYDVNNFGYHLWDYENHKIIRSRDVVFNEKVM